ncbi:MAG: hypothetical protein ACE5FY_03465 [Nitrospiria bacterium]
MNERQKKIEEDAENQSLIADRTPNTSLWHYQPIKGLTFFQELIVISVVTILGCVFTLTRLDLKKPHLSTINAKQNKIKSSSLASIGTLSSIGTIEDRFLPGLETPSLVRRFSSEKNSLEWFSGYPHPSPPDVASKKHTDFTLNSVQEDIPEKKHIADLADTGNLREVLKLIAGDIYANNANTSPDQYLIPEKWRTDLQGNEIVYKKYNQNSAVVYSSNTNGEDHGPDKNRPFYALIWPPNNHQDITTSAAVKKALPAPKRHIVSTKKSTEIKKPLEIEQTSQLLDIIQPSQKHENPQKKGINKKEILIPRRKATLALSPDSKAPTNPVAEKKEETSSKIQVIGKNLSPQVLSLSKRPEVQERSIQESTSADPKDSLIDKIAVLKPEDISHLTPGEMKETHLVWFTQGMRKLLSEKQLAVMPRAQWIYLSDSKIHRMSVAMRNSLGKDISLFQPERVEQIFSVPQIESFLESNIDIPEALSALTERMSVEQIAGISNLHFSVIAHWLNPTQISFAKPEQIAMLSQEAYARLDFSQRAAFTPLQRAAEAKNVFPNAATKSPTDTIKLIMSGSVENQRAEKKIVLPTQHRKANKKEGAEEENQEISKGSTETDIEGLNIPGPGQEKFPTQPVQMNPRLNSPVLSISEIRAMHTDRVREISPQQVQIMTARGHIHYFSEAQIQTFTSRQINSVLSSTKKNGELAYLIHRLAPLQIKMVSPVLCGKIYLDWVPENARRELSPQQLAAIRIGDPAYLSSLTSKQLSNLSLNQIVLTGKKGGIQHLSNKQIRAMTSAQITAFISEVTNSRQLTYLIHRLTANQIKALAPNLTEQIYLDWIPENLKHALSPEQIITIRIGDPKHLSSLTKEQLRLFDTKKLAKIEKKGGMKYISQVLPNERIAALKPKQHLFKEEVQRNTALALLIKELHPKQNKAGFHKKDISHNKVHLPAFDAPSSINTENKKIASLFNRSD